MDRAVWRFIPGCLHRCLCSHAESCNIQAFRHCRHDLWQYHHHRDHGWFFCSYIFHTSFGAAHHFAACADYQRAQLDRYGAGCAGNYRSRAAYDDPRAAHHHGTGASYHGSKQA